MRYIFFFGQLLTVNPADIDVYPCGHWATFIGHNGEYSGRYGAALRKFADTPEEAVQLADKSS